MDTKVVEITPAIAAKWLEGNVHNRPTRSSIVKKYIALMKAGRWKLTHQGIAFADEETLTEKGEKREVLIDGQHRLWAVFESGVTVKMMVTRGLSMGSQLLVDDHAKRGVIDVGCVYRGLKENLTARHVAAARLIWIHGFSYSRELMSNEQMVMFVKKYFDGLDFAVSVVFQSRAKPYVTQAGVLAVVTQAFYAGASQARLCEFGEVMLTGEAKTDKDHAAIPLREWLRNKGSRGTGRDVQLEVYRKSQRALLSFLQGQRLEKLYESKEQLFPMPGAEKESKKRVKSA